jgi:hypothetical protein
LFPTIAGIINDAPPGERSVKQHHVGRSKNQIATVVALDTNHANAFVIDAVKKFCPQGDQREMHDVFIVISEDAYGEHIARTVYAASEDDARQPVQCFGLEASAQAKTILGGQSVYLETDPSQDSVDKYGRTLAYVWTESGRLFNLDMIADGFAFEYTYDLPSYRYQQDFKAAENDARTQERGLWSPSACAA